MNETLTLDGYLEASAPDWFTKTFTRTFPATEYLPEVKVGLGLLSGNERLPWRALVTPNHVPQEWILNEQVRVVSEKTFTAAVEEKRLQLTHLPNWQEHLLLDLGYAYNTVDGRNWWRKANKVKLLETDSQTLTHDELYTLFNPIPEEEQEFLLEKHGFHKIAMMVAYGHNQNIDDLLRAIDECRGKRNYCDILRLMSLGVPVEDLPLAVQLPIEMIMEIYAASSHLGRK